MSEVQISLQGREAIFDLNGTAYKLSNTPFSLWLMVQALEDQLKKIPARVRDENLQGYGSKEISEIFKSFWETALYDKVQILENGKLLHLKANEIQPQDASKLSEMVYEWYCKQISDAFLQQSTRQQNKEKSSKASAKRME